MKAITKNNFQQEILDSKKVIMLDVWAEWCAPCRGMSPIVDEIAEETTDWADVVKLDASVEMELVQELGVTGLPTFLIFKNGKIVNSIIGMTNKNNLLDMMKKAAN